jgi:hypothetical protein
MLIILLAMELYIEELHNVFCPPNIVRTIKSSTMGCVAHVVRIGEIRNHFFKAEGKDYL